MTFLALLSPVVATALGWIALGQQLTPLQALGVLIILGSVTVAQLRPSPATALTRNAADAEGVSGVSPRATELVTSRARRPALPAPTNPEAITWAPPPQR